MNIKTASHYPFLASVTKFINEKYPFDISDFAEPEKYIYILKAVERIESAIDIGEIHTEFASFEERLISYPLAFLIVSYIGDSYLSRRWAFAESQLVEKELMKDTLERQLNIAEYQFGWKIKEEKTDLDESGVFPLLIHFTDYIKNAIDYHEPKWKLNNRLLINGYLPIKREELVKLLRTEIREFMTSRVMIKRSVTIPFQLEVAALDIEDYLAEHKPQRADLPTNLEAIPPCIAHMIGKLNMGINLSHTERFGLVAFLNHIGMETETLVELFRISPDFNEEVTRKQVSYITKDGERDEQDEPIGYNVYSCTTLKTSKLCKDDGSKMCKKAKHPLGYYRMKSWVIEQQEKEING